MNWSCLILRLGLGVMFMAHGAQKAFGLFGGSGIQGFSEMLGSLGFSPALFWAYLVGYVELICGLLVILGIFTRISSGLLLILILVAGFKVHLTKGFFLSGGGFEYVFIIACICIALVLQGAGKFSIYNKF